MSVCELLSYNVTKKCKKNFYNWVLCLLYLLQYMFKAFTMKKRNALAHTHKGRIMNVCERWGCHSTTRRKCDSMSTDEERCTCVRENAYVVWVIFPSLQLDLLLDMILQFNGPFTKSLLSLFFFIL